ncbi:branched-chain amino acid aminotransferase II [Aureobasidium pullulans]|nr:branched-chain amino acid aminotransferase II [Aureobasidium pullulans]
MNSLASFHSGIISFIYFIMIGRLQEPEVVPSGLSAQKMTDTRTKTPRAVPQPGSPEQQACNVCSDHMITVSWSEKAGWAAPELKPLTNISLSPAASVLHYATECFEGLKLYRGQDQKLRLFRPLLNCQRMLRSATRISLPAFEPVELLALIERLCAVDGPRWLPKDNTNGLLYVRPTLIGTEGGMGLKRPREALLYIIIVSYPNHNPIAQPTVDLTTQDKKFSLFASHDQAVRAWPGGSGYAKIGANYGPALHVQEEATRQGHDQVLWLFGPDSQVTEAGGANFFAVIRNFSGEIELITAPLDDKTILAGITRQSVLELADAYLTEGSEHELAPVTVAVRTLTMGEMILAYEQGRLLETFVVGTAYYITPVTEIDFRGRKIVPLQSTYARTLRNWIGGIQFGVEKHEWASIIKE